VPTARGEQHYEAKLTEQAVRAAREPHAKGVTQTSLARTYGVSVSALNAPVQRKTWRHVP
jgi:DNA-binding transcriptional regulator YiaG